MIECLDYKDFIIWYDGFDIFFFVDFLYCGWENYYKGNFKEYVKLVDMLYKIDGKCMVMYYGDLLILELYKDWNCFMFDFKVGIVMKVYLG